MNFQTFKCMWWKECFVTFSPHGKFEFFYSKTTKTMFFFLNYSTIMQSISFQVSNYALYKRINCFCLCNFTFNFISSIACDAISDCMRHCLQIFLILRRQGEVDDNQGSVLLMTWNWSSRDHRTASIIGMQGDRS